jgi:hypothetical protein
VGAAVAGGREEVRKQFIFEKKNQKTFAPFYVSIDPHRGLKQTKVFWFFFSKKNCFLPSFLPSLTEDNQEQFHDAEIESPA